MRVTKKISKYWITGILTTLLPCRGLLAAGTQQQDSIWHNIEYIRQAEAWLTSRNTAGLKFLPLNKLSEVNLFAEKANGTFVNYHQSGNSYTLGAMTGSYFRLNPQVVFSGKVLYKDFQGKNMGGSAFIDPYENPIDIADYPNNTKGTKKQEYYFLSGAVSSEVTSRLTLGGGIDYTAANYAKTRDLRHINTLFDMTAKTGLIYRFGEAVYGGVTYHYRRRVEDIKFGIYGNTDGLYLSFISFGAFSGRTEALTQYADYTGEKKPLVNNTHSPSLQLSIQINPSLKLFNEISADISSGYFGTKGTSGVLLTEHEGRQYHYRGVLTRRRHQSLHSFSLSAGYQSTSNLENVFRKEELPGSGSRIVYYGQNEVLDRQILEASLRYSLNTEIYGIAPRWQFNAGGNFYNRHQTVSFYPFYRKQTITSYDVSIQGSRNIIHKGNIYGITLQAAFGSGGGTARNDGYYATPSESQTLPVSMETYLYNEYEYLTATRVSAGGAFRYSQAQKRGIIPYLQAGYQYIKAFNIEYTGNQHHSIQMSVGCTF
ncbi:DUF6850 family outer membrane beta-barrel protein [Arcticibacter tournemirensis]|uniref:DUF6850 domain-containing protein n=1 Tax=Arcticibacter tournemirensis TaxID=699437 RepID=A0A4Q0MFJ3_9SPHI|nr:DUF6850 family outer membrane beta-barrel protein [Arcticibacter tournemirensis]RXF72281.1 hypothetical protein EKH83_00710 [Arcticibacter tournemirensis]